MENDREYRRRVALGLAALLLGVILGALLLHRMAGGAEAQEPAIRAIREGSGARILWTGPGCVYRYPEYSGRVRIGCYDGPGEVLLPDGLDWTRYPKGGDRYTLEAQPSGAIVGWAQLPMVELRLPIMAKAPEELLLRGPGPPPPLLRYPPPNIRPACGRSPPSTQPAANPIPTRNTIMAR